ncbi:MAG: bile acid:sodium symporter [Bacteroidia bacterium]|nr:bile acid:sodium symporter [Bacteroidia bacterium]
MHPKALIVGLFSQLIFLPLLTFGLVLLLKPQPSMALGMILVASCPGGNISNFISSMAKADVELSITLTCISSIAAIVFTPINFSFYGGAYEPTKAILETINLDWIDVMKTIALIIIIPIVLGKLVSHYKPKLAEKINIPFRNISMLLFLLIIVGALMTNGDYFFEYIGEVFGLVFLHNGSAMILALILAFLFKLNLKSRKSLTIETAIQNSGLGLLLIFSFFEGLGGMAIIAAWWGIWHIISGFALAFFWKQKV